MDNSETVSRINTITQLLDALNPMWHLLTLELDGIQYNLTQSLIAANDEQTRGKLKMLLAIKELPETLLSERQVLNDGLSYDPSQ